MSSEAANPSALRGIWDNLKSTPKRMYGSAFRSGSPKTDRTRSSFVFGNVFLHLHSVRTHIWSLKWSTTMGLGIMTTAAFFITLVTGILLMFYYKPYPDVAYQSMKDIHFVVPTGRFIRNIHRWAANLMVVAVILHMARTFFTASYRKPREFNWLVGWGLLVTTLALSFTGYLLPWDQLAYWAITIGANIAQSPREITDALGMTQYLDIGGLQRMILLGSDEVGAEALIRFYLLHVMLLPIVLLLLMAVHFWRIRKDGGIARPDDADELVSTDPKENYPVFTDDPQKTYQLAAVVKGTTPAVGNGPERTLPSMPHLFYAELGVLMLTTLICLALALISDAPLKEIANPMIPENPAKAPWYFLGLQEIVSFSAFTGGIGIPALCWLGLGLIPFLDRERSGSGKWFGGPGGWTLFKWSLLVGFGASVGIEAFAIHFGWLREWFPSIPQLAITFINPGTVLTLIYALFSVWTVRRYNSTRAGAVALFTCFLCGFVVLTVVGTYFRGPNWEFYWSPSDWPGH